MNRHLIHLLVLRPMGVACALAALTACSWLHGGRGEGEKPLPAESVKPAAASPKSMSPFLAPSPAASPALTDDSATTKPGNPAAWGEAGRMNAGRNFEPVYFDPGSDELDSPARGKLSEYAQWLANHPNVWVAVSGYCDATETARYGYNLAMSRAIAARHYLIGQGLAPERVYPVSYGSEQSEAAPGKLGNRVEVMGYIPPSGTEMPKPAPATPSPAPTAESQKAQPAPTALPVPAKPQPKKAKH